MCLPPRPHCRRGEVSSGEGLLSHPFRSPRSGHFQNLPRINGRIRAREVRVIGMDGQQVGVLPLAEAIHLARSNGVDLVEVSATAVPPVCKLIDYGKYRYEQAKKEKESRKHQHSHRVKEVQLSASIDPHDFEVKLDHAVGFLCEDMKVKVTLRFRGREMVHQEFGFDVVNRFLQALAPWGHADAEPKLVGRGVTVMVSPLPRAKRAKNPSEGQPVPLPAEANARQRVLPAKPAPPPPAPRPPSTPPAKPPPGGFANNPFANLDLGAEPGN